MRPPGDDACHHQRPRRPGPSAGAVLRPSWRSSKAASIQIRVGDAGEAGLWKLDGTAVRDATSCRVAAAARRSVARLQWGPSMQQLRRCMATGTQAPCLLQQVSVVIKSAACVLVLGRSTADAMQSIQMQI